MTRALVLMALLTGTAFAQSGFGVGNPATQTACGFGRVHSNAFSKDCVSAKNLYPITVSGDLQLLMPQSASTTARVTWRDLFLTKEDMMVLGIESGDGQFGFRPLPADATVPLDKLFR